MQLNENRLLIPFAQKSDYELKSIHLKLNKVYFQMLFAEDKNYIQRVINNEQWRKLESDWIKNEEERCYQLYDCHCKVTDKSVIETALKWHPIYKHPLFDFLDKKANVEQIKFFLIGESILNLEFFDYLALSIIGNSGASKAEIALNMWEEAGQGDLQSFHAELFRDILDQLNVYCDREKIIEDMPWEAIAGINLFSYLSLYSFNKIKYFGLLSATEMLNPYHYNKLIKGLQRTLDQKIINLPYHTEHDVIDVQHADGWLSRVVLPQLMVHPEKRYDFWLGFYMRLNSSLRYYDKLFEIFKTIKLGN